MTTKEALHSLIDALPASALPDAERYLRLLQQAEHDPFLKFLLDAPEDDEPLSPEDIAEIEEGKAEIDRGEAIPWEEAWERLRKLD